MIVYSTLNAAPDEPPPSFEFVGPTGTPAMVFGADEPGAVMVSLGRVDDLSLWLRESARRHLEFAELVEVRAMGAAS